MMLSGRSIVFAAASDEQNVDGKFAFRNSQGDPAFSLGCDGWRLGCDRIVKVCIRGDVLIKLFKLSIGY